MSSLSPQAAAILPHMEALIAICEQAHQAILPYWQKDGLKVEVKDDDSPVTKADKAANQAIVPALQKLTPNIPIISEEESHQPPPQTETPFWLVDPLDGTKSFIRGSDEFTVNIALVEHHRPVIGILGVPAQGVIYKAILGEGAWRRSAADADWEAITTAAMPPEGARVVSSAAHSSPKLDEWLQRQPFAVAGRVKAGSALKFARLAEGSADFYPRIGPTMEWDTAAGHCLLEAAGGSITDLSGQPFLYGKRGYLNGGFLASGQLDLSQIILPHETLS